LRLLPLVDGTRDRAGLDSAVNHTAVNIERSRAGDFVDYALEKVARLALLMADTQPAPTPCADPASNTMVAAIPELAVTSPPGGSEDRVVPPG
jgi:hypothetical protein